MKQKLYALDAFFIEKLNLSENDPLSMQKHQFLVILSTCKKNGI